MLEFELPFEATWTITENVPALLKPVVHVNWVFVTVCTAQAVEPIKTLTPTFKYIFRNYIKWLKTILLGVLPNPDPVIVNNWFDNPDIGDICVIIGVKDEV